MIVQGSIYQVYNNRITLDERHLKLTVDID